MTIKKQDITQALSQHQDPYLGEDWVTAQIVKKIDISGARVAIDLCFPYPTGNQKKEIIQEVNKCLLAISRVELVDVSIRSKIEPRMPQSGVKPHGSIKNMIAVGSGKGGVGKSTTAVNLALALAAQGAKVGLLDADIYGPNQPMMLGGAEKPQLTDDKQLLPVQRHGLKSMSMGYLVDANTPMVWRGPMISSALQQLVRDTQWGELDYLFVDLPPGTGDIQLTMAKKMPISGAVIVTTPQDVALLDARKALAMFNKVAIPVLGVVENMATHVCSQCKHEENIFGVGGGAKLAAEMQVPLLGQLPLSRSIREQVDQGAPTVVAQPFSEEALRYRDIALRLAAELSKRPKQYASLFSNVVVETS